MKEVLIYGTIYLIILFVFILLVLRAVFFTFVLKTDPLDSIKVVPKIKLKIKKGSLLEKIEKEKKAERLSKWG